MEWPISWNDVKNGLLPVVELTTPVTVDSIFTDVENNALTEAFNCKMPVVLRCAINTTGASVEVQAERFVCIAYNATSDGVDMFMIPGTPALLAFTDGIWVPTFE